MAITRKTPNLVNLKGPAVTVNEFHASAAITPGMLVELHSSTGTKVRKHATAGGATPKAVALTQEALNKGLSDDYATGDLVYYGIFNPGEIAYMLIGSGQNITVGDKLESAGTGALRVLASGVALFAAIETVNNTAGPAAARIRVEAL
jgi:hypothetical protein